MKFCIISYCYWYNNNQSIKSLTAKITPFGVTTFRGCCIIENIIHTCHACESRHPLIHLTKLIIIYWISPEIYPFWIPAFAGMTRREGYEKLRIFQDYKIGVHPFDLDSGHTICRIGHCPWMAGPPAE
jgi:hypothetical protein